MRILIVDDDALIRKWLELLLKQIPNREILVDKADNGLLALEKIQKGPLPDLLITDIKMPQMDGLTLYQHIKESCPNLPVVILSSYDEFAFVKKALQLGAIDYILKNDMSVDDIITIINEVEHVKNRQIEARTLEANRQLLSTFLVNSDTDERTFLLRLDSHLSMESLIIIMIRLNQRIHDTSSPNLLLGGSTHATLVPYHDTDYIAFIQIDHETVNSQAKQIAVGQFLSYMRERNDFIIEAWASTLNCNEIGIYTSIQTCRSVLKFKYYYGLENFSMVSYHEEGELVPSAHIPSFQRFFEVINRYQMQQATDLLWACMESFHHAYYHPSDIEKYMSLMCHKLLADISVLEVKIDWFNHTLQLLHDVVSAFTQNARRHALKAYISQCHRLFSSVKKQRPDIILKTLAYIDDHYSEKITLDQVASYVHLNSTYMSEIFKKEMGVTFNDYVNNLRIIRSCEHLHFSALSIGQIAERCGFTDQNYFTKVFKKYIGLTPSQYRTSSMPPPQDTQIV